ncbi:MAG: glycoside hydrolase family 127 protein, partial [Clostridia bacterium]|nr:glycoside hydrolase family 127 protein [Clostridia bacterium]
MMEYPYYKVRDTFSLSDGSAAFSGTVDAEIRAVIDGLFKKIDFSKTVDIFRNTMDLFAAGEFWGKLMRAACALYDVTGDKELKAILDTSISDMLSVQKPDGEISCTPRAAQPNGTHGSDLWERKYVLLGMFAYYRSFGDERVLRAMCALADYTCAQVGAAPKTPITETGWAFCGIESSSILEPIVKLYGLTGKAQYLELARHIVEETGGCARENIFLAIEAGKSPRDIGSNGDP